MTSKLPVVGKRYRQRETHQEVKVLNNFVRLRCAVDNFIYEEEGDYFNEFYEELPDSNPQEVEEDCPFETAAEEWNTAEEKEVSEVERALEELKTLLKGVDWEDFYSLRFTVKSAENLVIALEAEKARPKPEPSVDENEQAYYKAISKYPEGIRAHSSYPYEPCEICSDPKVYAELMSKPEPKIDIKEERVDPVSIWDKSPAFKIETESEYLHRLILGMQKDIEELKRKAT